LWLSALAQPSRRSAVIVAVAAVRMMEVAADEIVDVSVVWHGFMLALPMVVGRVMRATSV
jgi:hypothetical protein